MQIRVWYTGGREYRVRNLADWKALPEEGLVFAVVYRSTGRCMVSGGDWYWVEDGEIRYVSSGKWGTWQPKPEGCASCVKKGVGVSDEVFETIRGAAVGAMTWR